MAIMSQIHKEFSGRGQLLHDQQPPIPVRYYLLLSVRLVLGHLPASPQPIEWEWGMAHGFLTLCDAEDAHQLDVNAHSHYTLVLDDGTCCVPTLTHDNSRPHMKYRVQCAARELAMPVAITMPSAVLQA